MTNFVADCLDSKWDIKSGILPNVSVVMESIHKKAKKAIYDSTRKKEVDLKLMLRGAIHFSVGDITKAAPCENLNPDALLKLPFPVISVSYHSGGSKAVLMCKSGFEAEGKNWWFMESIRKYEGEYRWRCPTSRMVVDPYIEEDGNLACRGVTQYPPEILNLMGNSFTTDELDRIQDQSKTVFSADVSAVKILLNALAGEEYETKIHTPDYTQAPKLRGNAQRKKPLPMVEYRELVIKGKEEHNVVNSFDCLPCRPRREHVRRGHERNLKSGKVVWVRDCKVGSSRLGKVVKDYKLIERQT